MAEYFALIFRSFVWHNTVHWRIALKVKVKERIVLREIHLKTTRRHFVLYLLDIMSNWRKRKLQERISQLNKKLLLLLK